MEKTSKKTASETLEETLQRVNWQVDRMDTCPVVSVFRSKKSGQVLYLKAGKDFVDTLLGLLRLLSAGVPQERHFGAISSIYKSIEKLDSQLLLVDLCQDADAKRRSSPPKKKLVLPQQFYRCSKSCTSLSIKRGARCYNCWPENGAYKPYCIFLEGPYHLSAKDVRRLDDLVLAEQQPVEEWDRVTGVGFVKENITFIITDKLEIMPSATLEIMSLLKEMKVDSLADLESKKVNVTIAQVLQLLGSAFTCNDRCLDDVFGTGESGQIAGKTSTSEMHDATEEAQYLFCDEIETMAIHDLKT